MQYEPNWHHKSTRSRIRHALGFVRAVMSERTSRSWSSRYIDRYLGQSQKDISRYLKSKLLICTDERYQFGDVAKCKSYRLNLEGYQEVLERYLDPDKTIKQHNLGNYPSVYLFKEQEGQLVREWITQEFRDSLTTLEFTYTDKSQRLWHGLQNVRRQDKQIALADAGLVYQYDIVCAAPRLIQQLARAQGEDSPMPYLDAYLEDRTAIRSKLAQECDIEPDTVKRIINALLCGAHISRRPLSSINELLLGDHAQLEFLRQHPFIQGLRADFKCCWDMIKYFIPRKTTMTRRGHLRTKPLSPGQKWYEYFRLERTVLDSVIAYMDQRDNRYFLEHDGWTCRDQVDLTELKAWVRSQTAFDVEFDVEILDSKHLTTNTTKLP